MGIGVGLGLGLRRIRAGALPASFALGGRDRLCRSSRSSSSSSGGGGGGSSLLVDLGSFRSLGGFGVLAALDSSLSASGVGSRGSSSGCPTLGVLQLQQWQVENQGLIRMLLPILAEHSSNSSSSRKLCSMSSNMRLLQQKVQRCCSSLVQQLLLCHLPSRVMILVSWPAARH